MINNKEEADWFYYDEGGHLVTNRDMIINGYRYIFLEEWSCISGTLERKW